ncbi:MAG: amino acid adenylation domain-containing protein, partial [bacterium]|nr:amino acid adenylation domain-containing protein [bacterium]
VFKTPTIRTLALYVKRTAKNTYTSIEAVEKKEYYPLSSAQKRLFILQQIEMKSTVYNMPETIPLADTTDFDKLEGIFKQLIRRHESLRTSFIIVNEEPVQRIHDDVDFAISNFDLPAEDTARETTNRCESSHIRPFDLSRAPLLRVGAVKKENNRYLLFVDMHHIISDGASHRILLEDFTALYEGKDLAPLRIQYKDFSQWWNSGKEKENIKKQEIYWLKEFKGEVPVLNLPTDYPRPSIQSFEGGTLNFQLEKNETTLLKTLALEEGVTLYMVLLGLFNVFLSKVAGMEDIVIGTPTAGRRHPDLEQVMGMFVNTLALRNYPNSNNSFLNFLQEVKERTLEAFENQDYPFEDLVENVEVNRDAGRNPLFDVLFNFQGHSPAGEEPPGEYADETQPEKQEFSVTSKFDLTLHALDSGEIILFTFEYCSKLFKEETIRRFISYFLKTAGELLRHTDKTLLEADILPEAEKNRILYDFNDTAANYPEDKTIHQLFEEQVRKTPDHTALTAPDGPAGTMLPGTGSALTYKELDERAFLLACLLREKGVETGHIVGLALPRSLEIIVAMLAVLKAGGAYLPIDLQYPPERSRYMLEDSGTQLLLTTRDSLDTTSESPGWNAEQTLYLNEIELNQPGSNYSRTANPSDLAYIIYTSGTSGRPKGVMIEHRNVVRLFFNDRFPFQFDHHDTWTMFHSHCFDFSVWEIFGALLFGARLIIIPKMIARDSKEFSRVLRKERVTVLNQTPSAFYNLSREAGRINDQTALRYVIFGGEALNPGKLEEWQKKYPRVKLINMYGITETTVHVTFKEITSADIQNEISNIGTPIPTLSTYVFAAPRNGEANQYLQPIGVPGELCVAGAGLARGYLNRPQLTAEKFVENPFKPGELMYRSGDMARVLPNGEKEYLG